MFLSLLFFLSYLYGCHILSFWTGNGTSQSALDHFESNQANKQSGFSLGVVVNPFFCSMSSPSVFYVIRQLVKCAWLYRPRENQQGLKNSANREVQYLIWPDIGIHPLTAQAQSLGGECVCRVLPHMHFFLHILLLIIVKKL